MSRKSFDKNNIFIQGTHNEIGSGGAEIFGLVCVCVQARASFF